MPPKKIEKTQASLERSVLEVVEELGIYPLDAFAFLQEGLTWTCNKLHGPARDPEQDRHVTGQQLSEGLLEYSLRMWGMMAPAVLAKWNIHGTIDFGRIVFAMVNAGIWNKTDDDTLDDFRNVFDFKTAFEKKYRMSSKL